MRLLVTGGSGFIGTNLVSLARARGHVVGNVDIAPPRAEEHRAHWIRCDILEREALHRAFQAFRPTHVVHLAARTDTPERARIDEYPANTRGTGHVLAAVAERPDIEHLLVTSSQFVCRPGVEPIHDERYDPHTIYGWSKVITEQLTRHVRMTASWTILRPTTIWGPFSPTHPARMLRVMRRGHYLHPSGPCIRGYGYVENVVWQLLALFDLPKEQTHGRVLYVGDRLIDLRDWVDAFSVRVRHKPARVVPRRLLRLVARGGDAITALRGEPFLIQSGRFRSMTEHYPVPMEPIFALCGEPPYGLSEAIDRTLGWLAARERG